MVRGARHRANNSSGVETSTLYDGTEEEDYGKEEDYGNSNNLHLHLQM